VSNQQKQPTKGGRMSDENLNSALHILQKILQNLGESPKTTKLPHNVKIIADRLEATVAQDVKNMVRGNCQYCQDKYTTTMAVLTQLIADGHLILKQVDGNEGAK
jgi:hypothetical protein